MNSLNAGLNKLEQTVKALEKDDYPNAAKYYEQAREDLIDAYAQLR